MLFQYPSNALVSRTVPKNKIYQNAAPSSAVKALFVHQVESIVWQYKLSPETINLPATESVTEIQIFDITLKGSEFDFRLLQTIDKAIPSKTFFRLLKGDYVQISATLKQCGESQSEKLQVERYFSSDWQLKDAETKNLPVALNLQSLYEQMLQEFLPLPPRFNESLNNQILRLTDLRQKQFELQKLESRLQKEKQFNRKVEINAQIRMLKTAISQLEN